MEFTNLGFWKTKVGFVSHKNGLTEDQLTWFKSLKVGDRLVAFVNEVREGENSPHMVMKRSTFTAEGK